MMNQTRSSILDILVIHLFAFAGTAFEFVDDVLDVHHIDEQLEIFQVTLI